MTIAKYANIYTDYFIKLAAIAATASTASSIELVLKMRLTAYTDYTLRTLMYLGLNRDRLVTIQDIADLHGISKNHLMKVAHQLGLSGMVTTVRGRNGGLMLNKEAAEINIGEVVRNTETDFFMAECFNRESNTCVYAPSCALKGALSSATAAYLEVLDGVTLEDLLTKDIKRGNRNAAVKPIRLHRTGNQKGGRSA